MAVLGVVTSTASCAPSRDVATPARPEPHVVDVYPRGAQVPENVLRFYVYFSEPMAEGDFLEHVRVVHEESGSVVAGVFFDDVHELWSADRRRITLLVDPARVKTGLVAHEALGRAFRAGEHYALTIAASARTVRGAPLARPFVRRFTASPEAREALRPSEWAIEGRCDGARIGFGVGVDHVAVARLLYVLDGSGATIEGRWDMSPDDASATLSFAGALAEPRAVAINGRFEDVAGNNVNGAFDHRVGTLRDAREGGWTTLPLNASPSAAPCREVGSSRER